MGMYDLLLSLRLFLSHVFLSMYRVLEGLVRYSRVVYHEGVGDGIFAVGSSIQALKNSLQGFEAGTKCPTRVRPSVKVSDLAQTNANVPPG